MRDVIEVSYTGDLLAHRRCPRSWAYEKHAGFQPYEQVQAMEGRLAHHAMEWMTSFYGNHGRHATKSELEPQLKRHFRVLWARGIRTAFTSKKETLDRILRCLFPKCRMHATVAMVVEGAQHTEYELRAVRKLVASRHAGKRKLLLTGILDVVVLQEGTTYSRTWEWTSLENLNGTVTDRKRRAKRNDLEIWDYKAAPANTTYLRDYVIQLLTYAALYRERTAILPVRCVLYFLYEPSPAKQLVSIKVDEDTVDAALKWTVDQVETLQTTILEFQDDPLSVLGGELEERVRPVGSRVSSELRKQCTACGRRFDCEEYVAHLAGRNPRDIDRRDVFKN